jgi:hypothetical protein
MPAGGPSALTELVHTKDAAETFGLRALNRARRRGKRTRQVQRRTDGECPDWPDRCT